MIFGVAAVHFALSILVLMYAMGGTMAAAMDAGGSYGNWFMNFLTWLLLSPLILLSYAGTFIRGILGWISDLIRIIAHPLQFLMYPPVLFVTLPLNSILWGFAVVWLVKKIKSRESRETEHANPT